LINTLKPRNKRVYKGIALVFCADNSAGKNKMTSTTLNLDFKTGFVPTTRAGRGLKFVLAEIMPKIKSQVVTMPLSEGKKDKRDGKISIASIYSLVRDTGVSILFGTNSKTHKKEVALVREIPEDLKDLNWRLIVSKK